MRTAGCFVSCGDGLSPVFAASGCHEYSIKHCPAPYNVTPTPTLKVLLLLLQIKMVCCFGTVHAILNKHANDVQQSPSEQAESRSAVRDGSYKIRSRILKSGHFHLVHTLSVSLLEYTFLSPFNVLTYTDYWHFMFHISCSPTVPSMISKNSSKVSSAVIHTRYCSLEVSITNAISVRVSYRQTIP
jgi:hypothetical protein